MSQTSFLLDRPPRGDQMIRAWNAIAERERSLGLVEQELHGAQEELRIAERKVALLQHKQENLRAQLARDRNRLRSSSLPPETLTQIFQHCIDIDPFAAWVVSSVCYEWRQAALAPRIWSRVNVPYHRHDCETILRLWLDRSRRLCDLEISFYAYYNPKSQIPSLLALQRVLEILVPHIGRCRHFDFSSNLDDYIQTCLDIHFGEAPHLRSFAIREATHHPRVWHGLVQPCRRFNLGPAPQLTCFTLYDCMTWTSPLFSNANLTSLSLVTHRIRRRLSDIWAILRSCPPCLQYLTVRTTIDLELEPVLPVPPRPSFTLPSLIYLAGNAVLIHLLPCLNTPLLNTLCVNSTEGAALLRAINVLDLKCNPPMQTLSLKSIRGKLVMGTGFSLKSVRCLELIDCAEVDDSLFNSLAAPMAPPSTWIRPTRTWQLPSLETLIMRRVPMVTEDVVRRFIEARNPTIGHEVVTPSGEVTLTSPPTPSGYFEPEYASDSFSPFRLRRVDVRDCTQIIQPMFGMWVQERLSKIPREKWVRGPQPSATRPAASRRGPFWSSASSNYGAGPSTSNANNREAVPRLRRVQGTLAGPSSEAPTAGIAPPTSDSESEFSIGI